MQKRFIAFIAFLISLLPSASAMDVRGELKSAALENLTSDPGSGLAKGRLFYDSDDLIFRLYNGTSWLSIADLSSTQTFTNKTLTSPKINENVALTTTATKLNYLTSATGTTGTTSTNVVFSTSPVLVTPNLGTPSAAVLTNATGLPVSSGISGLAAGVATALATPSSANIAAAATDETGTGALVFSVNPVLTTPNIGTPSAGTLTNTTGLPLTSGVTGTLPVVNGGTGITSLGTGVATWLGTPSSANFFSAISDETGSGAAVGATSPTLVTPVLGVATATSINGTTIPSSKTLVVTTDKLSVHAATSSSELFGTISDETGTGSLVGANTPTLVTPVLGDASATSLTTTGTAGGGYVGMKEQASAPSTPASGTVDVYAKSDKKLYTKDSAGTETQVGAGGSGEINAVTSGSQDATGWTAEANMAVATTTTAAQLPLSAATSTSGIAPPSATAIRITRSSGTNSVYKDFDLPQALNGRKLKIEWHQLPDAGYASGDLKLVLKSFSDSARTTSATTYALTTDVSSVTSIPNFTGKFSTTFDADTRAYFRLYITGVAGITPLNITQLIVGPGIQAQGAVVSAAQSYTPTYGAGFGTTTHVAAWWYRSGEFMYLTGRFSTGTVSAAAATISIPTGYTISHQSANNYTVGYASHAGTNKEFDVHTNGSDSLLRFAKQAVTSFTSDDDASTFSNASAVGWWAIVRIAEWAGSGTVNTAQNDCEYAWNSATADSSDTTSFAYGPEGVAFGSYTAERAKRVRFLTPIGRGDRLAIEIKRNDVSNGVWVDIAYGVRDNGVTPYQYQVANTYGVGFGGLSSGSTTDVDVYFGKYMYASGATYGANGTAYSTAYSWRAKKCTGGQAVGFGEVAQSSSGLVKSAGQLKGTNTNDTAATGYVGEVITASLSATSCGATGVYATQTGDLVLTPGDWLVDASLGINCSTQSGNTYTQGKIVCSGGSGILGSFEGNPWRTPTSNTCVTEQYAIFLGVRRITVAAGATATCNIQGKLDYSATSNCSLYTAGYLRGTRMR